MEEVTLRIVREDGTEVHCRDCRYITGELPQCELTGYGVQLYWACLHFTEATQDEREHKARFCGPWARDRQGDQK